MACLEPSPIRAEAARPAAAGQTLAVPADPKVVFEAPRRVDGAVKPPPWEECDVFCIQGYGGPSASICGWRGPWFMAAWDPVRGFRICPRCGQASLLALPGDEQPPRAEAAPPGDAFDRA